MPIKRSSFDVRVSSLARRLLLPFANDLGVARIAERRRTESLQKTMRRLFLTQAAHPVGNRGRKVPSIEPLRPGTEQLQVIRRDGDAYLPSLAALDGRLVVAGFQQASLTVAPEGSSPITQYGL